MTLNGTNIKSALSAVGAVGNQLRSFDELARGANDALKKAPKGLTKEGAAAFLATLTQESAYLRTTTEYGSGQHYAPYIGRTFEQVTWESNYFKFGKWCKARGYVSDSEQFIKDPESLSDYEWAWLGGVWYFEETGLWSYANKGDFLAVSQGVNGGMGRVGTSFTPNGWDHRQAMYKAYLALGSAILPEGGSTGPRTVLQYGDSGDDVKALQEALGITADGHFGAATKAAVEAFQRAAGLTVDGVAGPLTMGALAKAEKPVEKPDEKPVEKPVEKPAEKPKEETPMNLRTITQAVAWAKVARPGYGGLCLKHARMAYGVPSKYQSAIACWNAIPASKKTVGTHRNAPVGSFLYWHPKGSPWGHVATVVQSGADPLVATTDSQQPTTKIYRASVFNKVGYKTAGWSWVVNDVDVRSGSKSASSGGSSSSALKYGDSGSKVKSLQKKLTSHGFEVVADGEFGEATEAAVRAFQKAKGLAQDGLAGPKTMAALAKPAKAKPKKPAAKKKSSKPAKLKVDSKIGPSTVKAIQYLAGTTRDGVISGQPKTIRVNGRVADALDACWPAIDYGKGGSQVVVWLQKKAGTKADGLLGPASFRAIQRMVGVKADGVPGNATAAATQRWINKQLGY